MEATMVVLDTTEFMRNSDYFPTRLSAEKETAFAIFSAKTSVNPQSGVGLMSLNGDVKVSFVDKSGPFRAAMDEIKIEKVVVPQFTKSVQVAMLALRHRNPSQRQRIIVLVGSEVKENEDELKKLALKLKKNGIAIDVITFGQEGENNTKLSEFVGHASSEGEQKSHFLDVPPGIDDLSVVVQNSPVLGRASSNPFGGDFGMEDDPELMLALRMSLEEEKRVKASKEQKV